MSKRVLVATYGSAGDLFPLIPVVAKLRELGHDVRCAVPRALGLYLRTLRLPTIGLGDGSEMRVLDDPAIVSTRFDGWGSLRSVAGYVCSSVKADVGQLDDLVSSWRPDVVAATSFASASRVVASRHRIPLVNLSIYPDHLARLGSAVSFGLQLRAAIAELSELDPHSDKVGGLAWGGRPTVLLHDQKLLGPQLSGDVEVVGFPYWDGVLTQKKEVARLIEWTHQADVPTLLITLGSYLGMRQREVWQEAIQAVDALGLRAICVGPRHRWNEELFEGSPGVRAVGFVPLSRVVPHVDAVVHHGGIGTMFAALRAGRPAAVIPQAFDQPYNARIVEGLGVGLRCHPGTLRDSFDRLLEEQAFTRRAATLADELVPTDVAAARVAEHILNPGRIRA